MNNPDWKPVNPCIECPASAHNDPQAFGGCEVSDTCVLKGKHQGETEGQKRLLRYQIANIADPSKQFESMLKQLEELE